VAQIEPDRTVAGDRPVVSYIIPAHNSAAVIRDTLESIAKRLAEVPAEIIVVENASADDTRRVLADLAAGWPAEAPALKVMSTARGFGVALRVGIAASSGRTVLITGDDLPFGFDDLDAAEERGFPARTVLIGSKAHPQSVVERSLTRSVLTGGLRLLRLVILGLRTADPQGSFVVDGDWARAIGAGLEAKGFLVTTEIAYAAQLAAIPVIEVPVQLRECTHPTRIRMSDIVDMFVGMLRLRRRRRSLRAVARATPPAPASAARDSAAD
jgi:dolichyl-phosphate beta-glucosyltransferase